ncbi:MAG: DUF131 domain-containing protein [Nanoarchaeota archaeon]
MALQDKLILMGIILIFLGFIIIIASSLIQAKTNVKSAGVVFIGPFPIGYASDKIMFYILIALTLVALIIFYLLKR